MSHFSLLLRTKPNSPLHHRVRSFRSVAALDALRSQATTDVPIRHLVLYNYPSFSGAFAALFARLHHSRLDLPCLLLPFSFHHPLLPADLRSTPTPIHTCYLLGFTGPASFAADLARFIPRVLAFDHRPRVSQSPQLPDNLEIKIDVTKSSARAVRDYFSEGVEPLLSDGDAERVDGVLRYIEDADLRRWELPDAEAFRVGIRDERDRLNCITNPYVFEQLLEMDHRDLIAKGKAWIGARKEAAEKLAGGAFKIQLGRGMYGECLAIRADGISDLSHEIAVELSRRSAAAGLRPIGAVIFIQRGNLKMCLRSTDAATDTSEIAKAYGGGGKSGSSSFIIRMDEYNHWTSVNWVT